MKRNPPSSSACFARHIAIALALLMPACRPVSTVDQREIVPQENGDARPIDEIWEVLYLQGTKVGYGHTTVRQLDRSGQSLLQIETRNHLSVVRFGQRTEQELKSCTLETHDGRVLEFRTEVSSGAAPQVTTGRADGETMSIETVTHAQSGSSRMPWSADIGGFRAVEQTLERSPLKPGQTRSLKMLMPVVNQVVQFDLTAHDFEETPILGTPARLLRIESVARLAEGNDMRMTLWVDDQGRTVKTRVEGMEQESFRTTREVALDKSTSKADFDLGFDAIVPLEKPLEDARRTREVRYRVELARSDPAKAFAKGPTQSIRVIDPHSIELTVRSVRPGDEADSPQQETPGQQFLEANSMLQIDDPRILDMAREARGQNVKPADIALALERHVRRTMRSADFSQALATAAEVAQSRQGDCTEYAVLLAALARACDIPSRVAIGLVYVERSAGFGYHMWTELFLDGQWVPLDATLGDGGIGADHIKLTDSSLAGASAYSALLPVAEVMGQLTILVLEAK